MDLNNETLQKIKARAVYPLHNFTICLMIFMAMFFGDKMIDGATFGQVLEVLATPTIFIRFVVMAYVLGMFVPGKKNK